MSRKMQMLLAMPLLLMPLTACSSAIRYPQLQHPGPADFQKNNALLYDPYPSSEMGTEIVGGRPREFQKPMSEHRRARLQRPLAPWRQAPLY